MENVAKRLYMREHSNVIRKFQSMKLLDKMEENPIFNIEGTNRLIIVTICRIRQRTLTHAWRRLIRNTGVKHDYEMDAKVILSRKLPDEELRTELEIEVLFNWIYSTKDIDPTGIANTIFLCKKRSAIYSALQQLRMEFYEPGETVLFQGDIPRPEDGHFTIFSGSCDVVQFPDESMPLMKLLYLAKKKKWDEARKLLAQAIVLARITKGSGFGELSTLTGVKRAATIRTDASSTTPTEIVVLPKQALLDCLKSRRQDGVDGAAPSEAMDFMRQSGLANRISPKDLVRVAQNMVRRTLLQGEILYFKGETVKSLFLVVSGELLLDTGDFLVDGKPEAFINSNPDNCYHMSSGSILGDEGVVGQSDRFSSTAVVVSDAAVVFEAVGFSMNFLTEKIGALRYCALTYRDKSRWSAPIHMAEEINPYTYFHSLRKAIAYTHPYRGSRPRIYDDATVSETVTERAPAANAKLRRTGTKSGKHKPQSNIKKLSPLVRMDSNLAYMLTTEQHDNPAPVTEFSFTRTLKPVGLHHALDINRIAKRLAQKFVKVHAQENILYDEMTKNLMAAAPGLEQQLAEAKFKNHITEYRERAAKHAAQVLREMEKERLSRAYTATSAAVKFYGSLSPDNSVGESTAGNMNVSSLRRGGFSREGEGDRDSDLQEVVQSRPFTTPMKAGDVAHGHEHEHEVGAEHSSGKERERSPTLNVSAIQKELTTALMLHDVEHLQQTETRTDDTAESYEDDQYFQRPRIIQYFIWIDHLNRHTYRSLLQQAQQTIDQNVSRSHEKLAVTDKTMEELTQIFNRFGLTPTDMNIPWRPGSPKSGLAHYDDLSDEEEPKSPVPVVISSRPTTATSVPALDLPKTVVVHDHKAAAVDATLWGRTDKEKELHLANIKLQGKFKTYNPSSWRHEIIMKKEKGVTKENFHLFLRSTTPDNRRICGRYYHYPGHHHPDYLKDPHHVGSHDPHHRTLSGRPVSAHTRRHSKHGSSKSPSRPGSRPLTGTKHLEEELDAIQLAKEKKEHDELLANFAEVPEKFMEAVKAVDLSKKNAHLPNKEWSTRYLRSTVEMPPGDSASAAKAQRIRDKQASRSIPSESYSKQVLLGNAKAIQDKNATMYTLTDSAQILEKSLQSGMLHQMRSMKSLRNSFLSPTASMRGSALAAAQAAGYHTHAGGAARRMSVGAGSTAPHSRATSVGNLSADGEMSARSSDKMRRQSDSHNAEADGEDHKEGDGDDGVASATGDEDEGEADHDAFDEDHHSPHQVDPSHASPGIASPHREGGDDRSIESISVIDAISQSHMSPVAPAPSHIDQSVMSGETLAVHLQSALARGDSQTDFTSAASPQPAPLQPLEVAPSNSDLLEKSPHGGHTKAADAAAQRTKELREKIIAHAPSDALEAFNTYMRTDNNPRKFYEGKKKAGANSKYALVSSLRGSHEELTKPSAAEQELFGTRKSGISKELALFNSLFPDSTEEQRKEFMARRAATRLAAGAGAGSQHGAHSLAESPSKMSVKDLQIEASISTPAEPRSRAASRTVQELEKEGGVGRRLTEQECEELDLDPDVVVWQNFTLDIMHREKTGPKKILPVLIMKNEGGASSRRFAVNKSKRWGSGVLLQLASEAEEAEIDGPPTYLEIFKGTQRRKLREKDRKRILDELHAIVK